jgi:hypothetical protein
MERNCCAVMVSVSKAPRHLLYGFRLAVQPLSHGIHDPMFEVGQDVGKVPFQGLYRFIYDPNRCQWIEIPNRQVVRWRHTRSSL